MKQGTYNCDCGSAAVRIGENLILYSNGVGDGEYRVFEFENKEEFRKYCKSAHVLDPLFLSSATFKDAEVVDSDCGCIKNLNTLFKLNGRYGIYNSNAGWELSGEVYFVKWED